jgi:hypothetical protein
MKGLNNRTEFENEWQKAFSNAESEPSPDVWAKIDAFLANNDATHFRRKAFYYKLVAAASIILAVGLGTWGIMSRTDDQSQIASQNKQQENVGMEGQSFTGPQDAIVLAEEKKDSGTTDLLADDARTTEVPVQDSYVAMTAPDHDDAHLKDILNRVMAMHQEEGLHNETEDDMGLVLAFAEKRGINELHTNLSPRNSHVNKVMDLRAFYAITKPKTAPNNLWAGVSFSGGNFDPEFSRGGFSSPDLLMPSTGFRGSDNSWYESSKYVLSPTIFAASGDVNSSFLSQTINKESDPGISYSMGFNMGGRITNKFVWQSGLFYAKRMTSSSTSFFVVDDNNKIFPLHVSNSATAITEGYHMFGYQFSEVPISNNYQFISVPVKAGYSLIDKTFGATVFTGVSSEFFMGNKIDDQGNGGWETVTIKPGSESPYRTIWFNGLVSMELKYNFGRFYSAFIEPSYKVSLNSLTKSDFMFSSYPKSFHIGMGVKFNLD